MVYFPFFFQREVNRIHTGLSPLQEEGHKCIDGVPFFITQYMSASDGMRWLHYFHKCIKSICNLFFAPRRNLSFFQRWWEVYSVSVREMETMYVAIPTTLTHTECQLPTKSGTESLELACLFEVRILQNSALRDWYRSIVCIQVGFVRCIPQIKGHKAPRNNDSSLDLSQSENIWIYVCMWKVLLTINKVKVKVFIVAYTKFLQRSEILMTWEPTSTQ